MPDKNGGRRDVLRTYTLSKAEEAVIREAAAVTGVPIVTIVRDGALAEARRRIRGASKRPAGTRW